MDTVTRNAAYASPCNPHTAAGHLAVAGATVTVMPGLFDEEPQQIARILVHESAHIHSGLNCIDVAYGHSRLGRRMDTANARRNADSYALMVTGLNNLTVPRSTPVEDALSALPDEATRELARDTLAYLQRWVEEASLIASHIYTQAHDGLEATPPAWPSTLSRDLMADVGREMGVPTSRDHPSENDLRVVSALNDRFERMDIFDQPITVTPLAGGGNTIWTDHHIQASAELWRRPLVQRIRLLLRRLITITPGISNEVVGGYVNLIQIFSRVRGIGP